MHLFQPFQGFLCLHFLSSIDFSLSLLHFCRTSLQSFPKQVRFPFPFPFPCLHSKFTDYILPLPHVFSLTKMSNDIVLKLIQSIPLNKASGLHGISAKLLKEAGPIVSASLTYIINRSLTTGIFPNDWKVARVTPSYKDDVKTNPNNCRPISVLPIVSKLIERIVFNQLYAFLMRHDLLADAQSGFRPYHSTLAIPL